MIMTQVQLISIIFLRIVVITQNAILYVVMGYVNRQNYDTKMGYLSLLFVLKTVKING